MGRCIYLRKGEVHTPPIVGIKAGDLPIGQIVKLMESGVETEFIVVNQGIPENSSLYDVSCDGTWLLRKDINTQKYNEIGNNVYSTSTFNTYLNNEYFNSLGAIEQKAIKQVKIPYVNGIGSEGQVASGENGLSVKVFLLGGYEVGYTTTIISGIPVDGANLGYFIVGSGSEANNKRIARYNNYTSSWWLRSPPTFSGSSNSGYKIDDTGEITRESVGVGNGIRPALIIPSTSIFDPTTYLLKK